MDANSILSMLAAHEDRLQRLEAGFSDLASSVAEQNATMRAFSQQMAASSDSVCEKLEDVSSRLSDKIGNLSGIAKESVVEVSKIDKRVAQLESSDVTATKWGDWGRQVLIIAMTGMGGAVGTLLIQYLQRHQ